MVTVEGEHPSEEPIYIEATEDGVTLAIGYLERQLTRSKARQVANALLEAIGAAGGEC